MRILHIVPEFEEGGVERYVLQLAKEQLTRGHRVFLAAAAPQLKQKAAVSGREAPQFLHTMGSTPLFIFQHYYKACASVRQELSFFSRRIRHVLRGARDNMEKESKKGSGSHGSGKTENRKTDRQRGVPAACRAARRLGGRFFSLRRRF